MIRMLHGAPYGTANFYINQWVTAKCEQKSSRTSLCNRYVISKMLAPFLGAFLTFSPAAAGDVEQLVRDSAAKIGVPVNFALAIAKKETGLRCGLVGARGERGLLQVSPATAAANGYTGISGASCAVQTEAGIAALKSCLDYAHGNKIAAARCYNGGQRMTYSRARSVNRYAADVARLEAQI